MRSTLPAILILLASLPALRADLLPQRRRGGILANPGWEEPASSPPGDTPQASPHSVFLGGSFRREASSVAGVVLTHRQRVVLVLCTIASWSLLIFVSTFTLFAAAKEEKVKAHDTLAWKKREKWSNATTDDDDCFLEERFEAASERVSEALRNQQLSFASDEASKEIYGLYKQVLEGDAEGQRPWFFMRRRCAKWDRWASMKGMSREDAMARYVDVATSLLGGSEKAFSDDGDAVRNVDRRSSNENGRPASSNVRERFDDAAKAIRIAGEAGEVPVPNMYKLKLYALFKQANCGDASGTQPSAWNVQRRAMWDAWAGAKGLPEEVAMEKYIDTVDFLFAHKHEV